MHMQFIAAVAVLVFSAGCSSNSDAAAPAPATTVHRKAYVGPFGDQSVAVLDTVTKQVMKTIPVTAPDGLVITPDGKKVYVSSTDSGSVKVIVTADDTLATSIDVGAKPAGIAITPDGTRVVASVGGANEAVIIDTSSDTVTSRIAVAAAHASCITADGRWAYVASQATGAPAIVQGRADRHTRPLDHAAQGRHGAYITNEGDNNVVTVDLTTQRVVDTIAIGNAPRKMVLQP